MPARVKGGYAQFNDSLVIQEMAGPMEIPLWAGVNLELLTANDPDPKFLTLPIGEINATSANNRFYDREFVQELEQQAARNRPIGMMGHLAPHERGHKMAEAIHWIGAMWKDNQLWGKGYVPPGESRDRINRFEATGTRLATSIDAWAEGVWDDAKKVTRMLAKTLRLNQIDIAPADRAGIASLSAVPILTTEMDGEPITERVRIMPMSAEDRSLIVQELKGNSPAPQKGWIPPQNTQDGATLGEIRELLGVDESADVKGLITELAKDRETTRKSAIASRVTELAGDPKDGIAVEAIRGLVVEMVELRQPATVADAEAAYKEVVNSDRVKAALSSHVIQEMGPNQGSNNQAQHGGKAQYFPLPQKKEAPKPQ